LTEYPFTCAILPCTYVSDGGGGGIIDGGDGGDNFCANVYAFSPDEQMVACCGCPVSANGLRTLSVKQDILRNTLTPTIPQSGVVKILSSIRIGGTCRPEFPLIIDPFHAWATQIRPTGGTSSPLVLTETKFSNARLSGGELTRLTTLCGFIQSAGSGYGICSCGQKGAP